MAMDVHNENMLWLKMFTLEEIIGMHPLEKYVTIDKDIVGGAPVFKGTRVTVKTLFDCLEESSLDEFLQGHPSVSREQAEAVIERAAEKFLTEFTS